MGVGFSSARTTDQNNLGLFFNTNFLANYNQVARDVANARLSSIDDSARLFALVNLAIADAIITAWDSKRHFVFWRPVTAIQEAANAGNPHPIPNPNYHPST